MSKSPKNSLGAIVASIIMLIVGIAFLPIILGVYQILINILCAVVLVPVILYIWTLVGTTIGMGLFGLVSPSYADKLLKTMNIDFPDSMKSSGYWITLVTSIAYLFFAIAMCSNDDIHKPSGEEKFLFLLKCAFFYALPFIGMFRMVKSHD
jgi:hypothetical protein